MEREREYRDFRGGGMWNESAVAIGAAVGAFVRLSSILGIS